MGILVFQCEVVKVDPKELCSDFNLASSQSQASV